MGGGAFPSGPVVPPVGVVVGDVTVRRVEHQVLVVPGDHGEAEVLGRGVVVGVPLPVYLVGIERF